MYPPLVQLKTASEDPIAKEDVGCLTRRILVLTRNLCELEEIPARFANGTGRIAFHPTRRIGEALFALAQGHFDAAVCTVEVPEDAVKIVRCRRATDRIPVLALVPQVYSRLAAFCLQMGAQAVLRMGATSSDIAAALHATFSNSDLSAAESGPTMPPPPERKLFGIFPDHPPVRGASISLPRALAKAEGFQPLLVEDDPNQSLLFARALRRMGLRRRVPVARSPSEAIEYLSGGGALSDRSYSPRVSLVILDFHLGLETGEKVLRWLRGEPKLEKLPVVLFTSCQDPATLSSMADLGISAHFVKPPSLDGLVRTLERILDSWYDWICRER